MQNWPKLRKFNRRAFGIGALALVHEAFAFWNNKPTALESLFYCTAASIGGKGTQFGVGVRAKKFSQKILGPK